MGLDFHRSARNIGLIDDSIQAASRDVEGLTHRLFYPQLATRYFDWINYQRVWPWVLYLEQWELAAQPTDPAAVKVANGAITIPLADCRFEPINSGPPFTSLELDRSSNSSFGGGSTPQRDISITGWFGYDMATAPAGGLAADISTTGTTTASVTNSAVLDVGDTMIVDTERMLITDKAYIATGQSQTGVGCGTKDDADNILTVADPTKYFPGEFLRLDAERMYVEDTTATTLIVKRAVDGTRLATHTAAAVYAPRQFTVVRGGFGTTAATHTAATACARHLPPSLITDWATGIAEDLLIGKQVGFVRSIGGGNTPAVNASLTGLADLRTRAYNRYGRQARMFTV